MNHGAIRPSLGRVIGGVAARLRRSERGQSLTELALILPVILLLTVVALDFGRIYLGYINVQNMARIAANYAANNPLAWGTPPDTKVQLRYRNQVIEDMAATNCTLPVSGGSPVIPNPTFTDVNHDGLAGGLGDTVTVAINCRFAVATPIIAGILGNSVQVTAESNFPVKAGMTAVIPPGGPSGGGGGGTITVRPNAAFVANSSVFSPDSIRVTGPDVTVDFRDASGGGTPTEWDWHISDGLESHAQDIVHTFHCVPVSGQSSCEFWVQMRSGNTSGPSEYWAQMSVVVLLPASVDFSANRVVIDRRQSVTFTDLSTPGGTLHQWFFGSSAVAAGTGTTFTYQFNVVGTFTVRHVVTYPEGPGEMIKTNYIVVNPGYCTVPSLTNVKFNDANAIWQNPALYGFTGNVRQATGAPSGNFKITAQSIASGNGATAICTSDVYVSSP